jgi:hypothetical protein
MLVKHFTIIFIKLSMKNNIIQLIQNNNIVTILESSFNTYGYGNISSTS